MKEKVMWWSNASHYEAISVEADPTDPDTRFIWIEDTKVASKNQFF